MELLTTYPYTTPVGIKREMPLFHANVIEAQLRADLVGSPEWRQLSFLKDEVAHYQKGINTTQSEKCRIQYRLYIDMAYRLMEEFGLMETGIIA